MSNDLKQIVDKIEGLLQLLKFESTKEIFWRDKKNIENFNLINEESYSLKEFFAPRHTDWQVFKTTEQNAYEKMQLDTLKVLEPLFLVDEIKYYTESVNPEKENIVTQIKNTRLMIEELKAIYWGRFCAYAVPQLTNISIGERKIMIEVLKKIKTKLMDEINDTSKKFTQ